MLGCNTKICAKDSIFNRYSFFKELTHSIGRMRQNQLISRYLIYNYESYASVIYIIIYTYIVCVHIRLFFVYYCIKHWKI